MKKSVTTAPEEYTLLREIENLITPKAFELIKNQASLFPRYQVSSYDFIKGYYVMYQSCKVPSTCKM